MSVTPLEIRIELFEPLKPLFRVRRDWDDDKMVNAWARALKPYDADDLRRAVDYLCANPPGREFPDFAEVKRAIIAARPTSGQPRIEDPYVFAAAWRKRALAHPSAPEMARAGILPQWVRYAEEKNDFAGETEVGRMQIGWRDFLQCIADLKEGTAGCRDSLLSLARTMLEQNVLLCEEIGERSTKAHKALARFESAIPFLFGDDLGGSLGRSLSETKKAPVIAEEGLSQELMVGGY